MAARRRLVEASENRLWFALVPRFKEMPEEWQEATPKRLVKPLFHVVFHRFSRVLAGFDHVLAGFWQVLAVFNRVYRLLACFWHGLEPVSAV